MDAEQGVGGFLRGANSMPVTDLANKERMAPILGGCLMIFYGMFREMSRP
jgi:hypothetical protein